MPTILPVSSTRGRTVASSTSTTRLAFSSTTPTATQKPYPMICPYRTIVATNAIVVRWSAAGSDGVCVTTVSGGTASAWSTFCGSIPAALSAAAPATCRYAASSTASSAGSGLDLATTVPPSSSASTSPSYAFLRSVAGSVGSTTRTSSPAGLRLPVHRVRHHHRVLAGDDDRRRAGPAEQLRQHDHRDAGSGALIDGGHQERPLAHPLDELAPWRPAAGPLPRSPVTRPPPRGTAR